MGSGKSYWLRWTCIYWLIVMYYQTKQRGIRAGLFCEDYPSLNDRHISKARYEFPDWLGKYNEARHEFILHDDYGSGVIAFRNLDDAGKYLSSEFAVIAVDEITQNPKNVFNILRTRLRWPGIRAVKFFSASNPVGERWVKDYFVDHNFPPEETERNQFAFVPALPTDNPHLDAEYFSSLQSLPDYERKAFLEGDWTAFEREVDDEGYMRLLTENDMKYAIIERPKRYLGVHTGFKIMGIDPGAGGDETTAVIKSDLIQEIVLNQKLKDTMMAIPLIRAIGEKNQIDKYVIDVTGVGKGMYDRMKELGMPVIGIHFGGVSSDKKRYENLKAELYWKVREWILHGGKLVKEDGWNQFLTVKYRMSSDGRLRMQGKDELRRSGISSPNVVDAACMTLHVNVNSMKKTELMKGLRFNDKMSEIWKA